MTTNLYECVRQWVLTGLPYDRNDQKLCAELEAMDARDLLIVYHNWMVRHVHPTPRKVFRSKAFDANSVAIARKDDLDALIAKIERGDDLKPHLSTRTDVVWEGSVQKLNRRRDLDLMLLEWHVHHLHISRTMQADGYVQRDGPLLFVVFLPDAAYILDLMTHADFNRDHILKILADEWPGAELIYEIKGGPGYEVKGLAVNYTEEERNQLRKVAINTMIEIDGRVFKPAGGLTTAGTSIEASMAADKLLKKVKMWQDALDTDIAYFQRDARRVGRVWPAVPDFAMDFVQHEGVVVLALHERHTQLAYVVGETHESAAAQAAE
ncbi:hypothetical protein [Aureimonas sp. SK2]|uniref:hypothetical protein n=1 Tax=Aureimonas sp. SK2 TaxID=3015992 RepID=UPI002443D79C|nr:hypothetical protein [Aureimonas sp. SK2]